MSKDLKETLNLPQTGFPMRANLVEREPARVRHWEKLDLYGRIQAKNNGGSKFILHDGPPFTNGDLHLGHALNKTLKDIILRHQWMKGIDAPYVPGWDSHGLPIEHRVSRGLQASGTTGHTPLEIRRACADFADKYRRLQTEQFQRLGVIGDWADEYWTIHPEYEAAELETFAHFVEQGFVYRSKKPVYWSIPCSTALAEAEIEYLDHKSISVHVKFPLAPESAAALGLESGAAVVIWTTTPWTIPANLAVAVNPKVEYSAVKTSRGVLIVATDLIGGLVSACGLEEVSVVKTFPGSALAKMETRHPFIRRPSPILEADYVTTDSGTGCVHTAPGHGLEDYHLGMKHGLEIYCPINDGGRYVDDGRIPPGLAGLSVLEEEGRISGANQGVLKMLAENNALLAKKPFPHSYPHCWRSKTPVVFRAMDQWFIALDHNDARRRALEALDQVGFIPKWGENRMRAAIENRPDWCISRQRTWGVPIPAFYDESGKPYLDAGVVRAIAAKFAVEGSDSWFEKTAGEILKGIPLPPDWPEPEKLHPGRDTLDVWIDSGCSHRAVLRKRPNLSWPADLYLEGSDQHRGWFQSSLWTSIIADGSAPFRTILTHGFIVKEDGTKLSKSDGEARPLTEWIQQYGADVVRLWIFSQDYRGDVPVSDHIVGHIANSYRTLRNTLRFQISNLFDFRPGTDSLPHHRLHPIDRWILHRTRELALQVSEAYDKFEFHRAFQSCNHFCTVTLSAVYHDLLKDRLYTLAPDSEGRRSAQSALFHVFETLVKLLAPVLVFTADEAWAHAFKECDLPDDSVHLQDWPSPPSSWDLPELAAELDSILAFRSGVNERLEECRQSKTIGKSLEAAVTITGPESDPVMKALAKYRPFLTELFIVSEVEVHFHENPDIQTTVRHADGHRCGRCWRWVPALDSPADGPEVCPRCSGAITALNLNTRNTNG